MSRALLLQAVARAARELAKAHAGSSKAAAQRAALGTDCTRAKMTTANARWMRAAEDRDRKEVAFRRALEAAGYLAGGAA